MNTSKIIAGIEMGTGTISVLLGEIIAGRRLNIIGMKQCSSKGIQKGDIVDFHEASDCVHAAILNAEKQANATIDGVYLAQSGTHILGFSSEASVSVSSDSGCVSEDDILHVSSSAQSRELPENRTIIHHLKRPFRLDGHVVEAPEGMRGNKLEASYWTAHGDARKISDPIHIINGFNLHVDDIALSGLAAGAVVSTPEERQSGALVIDIGSGTTDYALYSRGCCMVAGCLPVGGDHISNDLSIGLRMRVKLAESFKVRYGSAVAQAKEKGEKVWLNDDLEIGDRPVPLWSLEKIVALRMTEIFEVVRKKLGSAYHSDRIPGGVILCGGGSLLKNIDECASRVFEAPARVGDNSAMASGELRDSRWSVALGLLHYGLRSNSEREFAAAVDNKGSLVGKIKGLFQKA